MNTSVACESPSTLEKTVMMLYARSSSLDLFSLYSFFSRTDSSCSKKMKMKKKMKTALY